MYSGYRYPSQIISHTVWLYFRFTLSYRDIEELQNRATQWLWTYNYERPNMGIGGITPIQKRKLTQRKTSTSDLH